MEGGSERAAAAGKLEVIVLPFHGQGHMNPMLQFAKRLSWKGASVTLATVASAALKLAAAGTASVSVHTVYDDSADDPKTHFMARMDRFRSAASPNLAALIAARGAAARVALVYDANLPWAAEVAKSHGVPAAAFFTQACAYVAAYYPLYLQSEGREGEAAALVLPDGLPGPDEMRRGADIFTWAKPDRPGGLHPIILMVLKQFPTLHLADWVLFNSFHALEAPVIKWLENLWPVKTVGPTLPSAYLDKRVENDVDYGFNLFKPNNDECMDWLSTKASGSVVYVSFGSAAHLSPEQIGEIAEALKTNPGGFLWVVRETEQGKLPSDFVAETSDKGLVVTWCPQLDVLAHEAVGCFVTHCGWNSTIEALSFGVPMLAMPQFMDQLLDAHFVDGAWGVGVRPKADEKGLVTRHEIGRCLREILEGEGAERIRKNAAKWKALAKEAVDEGGSSDKQIDEILATLMSP